MELKEKHKSQAQLLNKMETEKYKLNQKLKALVQFQKDKEGMQSFYRTIKQLVSAIDRKLYHKEHRGSSSSQSELQSSEDSHEDIIPFIQLLVKKVHDLLLDFDRLERNLAARDTNNRRDTFNSAFKAQNEELQRY